MRRRCSWIAGAVLFLTTYLYADDPSFLNTLRSLQTIASTVPRNGDVNPHGVAVVPNSTGALVAGRVLVSNFNNSANLQGTGTTIVQVSPEGVATAFAQIEAASLPGPCPGGVGLTTALAVLRSGFVIVGSLPTSDGTAATAQAGCLIFLDNMGKPVATLSGHGINGPWDMTALDLDSAAVLFVSNVLNGTVAANGSIVSEGSVVRILVTFPLGGTPAAVSYTPIATKFQERTDPAALVIGPTGLGLGFDGALYVADTLQNRIAAIPAALVRTNDAGAGFTVAAGGALKQPLGLAITPLGTIVTVNAADGLMVETSPDGKHANSRFVDVSHSRNGAGTLFGLAVAPFGGGIYFVDDGNNTLNIVR